MTDTTEVPDDLDTYLAAPPGLSESATQLWDRTIAALAEDDLIPDPAEHRLLSDAVRTADLVDRLAAEIESVGLSVRGPGGRMVPNPMLATLDTAKRTSAQLLKTLRESTRAESSRANATKRWRG